MDALLVADNETVPKRIDSPSLAYRVLFVCTGNTCRSPMAAALWNARYGDESHRAVSAGLAADGSCISKNAAEALFRKGIRAASGNDYLSHISHTVNESDMEKADIVIGMTQRHAMNLLFAYPKYANKITVLPADISDPFGGDLSAYEKCLNDISEAFDEMYTPSEDDTHD